MTLTEVKFSIHCFKKLTLESTYGSHNHNHRYKNKIITENKVYKTKVHSCEGRGALSGTCRKVLAVCCCNCEVVCVNRPDITDSKY